MALPRRYPKCVLLSLSSTQISQGGPRVTQIKPAQPLQFASRVQGINPEDSIVSITTDESSNHDGSKEDSANDDASIPYLPPMLSYLVPSAPLAPLVRRVDSTPLLLSVSLLLAKLPSLDQDSSTPFSHASKIHPTSQPAQGVRVSVSTVDSLVASNTTLSLHCTIKKSFPKLPSIISSSALLTIAGMCIMRLGNLGLVQSSAVAANLVQWTPSSPPTVPSRSSSIQRTQITSPFRFRAICASQRIEQPNRFLVWQYVRPNPPCFV